MWFSKSAVLLFVTLFFGVGCGFTPLHGPNGNDSVVIHQVHLPDATNRLEFVLNGQLERRLGNGRNLRYMLDYDLDTKEESLAITHRREITRYSVIGNLTYRLRDAATGHVILQDKIRHFTAYSSVDTPVATEYAKRDAYDRLMSIMADQMTARITAHIKSLSP